MDKGPIFIDKLQLNHFFEIMLLLPPFRQNMEETDISDTSDADDTERLGEKIFSLVEELDPLHANDITGDLILCLSLSSTCTIFFIIFVMV